MRPEHLTVGGGGAFAATGVVELVERLGEASYAHVRRADDKLMVAEIRGRETPSAGDSVTLSAPAEDLHAFDAGRTEALGRSARGYCPSRARRVCVALATI